MILNIFGFFSIIIKGYYHLLLRVLYTSTNYVECQVKAYYHLLLRVLYTSTNYVECQVKVLALRLYIFLEFAMTEKTAGHSYTQHRTA